jgi:3-mercaptopyruvate sulfurtransferase SseA
MSAALVVKRMVDHGFNDVAPLAGGMEAWRTAGYALEPLLLDAAMNESIRAITKSTEGDR